MSNASQIIEVENLSHTYGQGDKAVVAIGDVTFSLEAGRSLAIVGPSGAGKTTLLRCLTGLMRPTSGTVRIDGKKVTGVPKGIGVVFQDYSRSLYPWLDAVKNVTYPLRDSGLKRAEQIEKAQGVLELVGLRDAARKYPWQLSGGMQQRVAIARALVTDPRLLFMDEPFASVDAQTRAELEDLSLEIRSTREMSVVSVTHDIDESVYLSDQVLVLSSRPSRVLDQIPVDIPYPRDQVETKGDPVFLAARQQVHHLIAAEKMKVGTVQ